MKYDITQHENIVDFIRYNGEDSYTLLEDTVTSDGHYLSFIDNNLSTIVFRVNRDLGLVFHGVFPQDSESFKLDSIPNPRNVDGIYTLMCMVFADKKYEKHIEELFSTCDKILNHFGCEYVITEVYPDHGSTSLWIPEEDVTHYFLYAPVSSIGDKLFCVTNDKDSTEKYLDTYEFTNYVGNLLDR